MDNVKNGRLSQIDVRGIGRYGKNSASGTDDQIGSIVCPSSEMAVPTGPSFKQLERNHPGAETQNKAVIKSQPQSET